MAGRVSFVLHSYRILLTLGSQSDCSRRPPRPRSTTLHSHLERHNSADEEPEMSPSQPERPWIHSNRSVSSCVPQSPQKELSDYGIHCPRPNVGRSTTYDVVQPLRDSSPIAGQRMARVPSDSLSIRTQKAQLRSTSRIRTEVIDDPSDTATYYSNSTSSPDRYFDDRAPSPATSYGSVPSRNVSSGNLSVMNGKKPPPPPPPSRVKKPPPPPPPPALKRVISAGAGYA